MPKSLGLAIIIPALTQIRAIVPSTSQLASAAYGPDQQRPGTASAASGPNASPQALGNAFFAQLCRQAPSIFYRFLEAFKELEVDASSFVEQQMVWQLLEEHQLVLDFQLVKAFFRSIARLEDGWLPFTLCLDMFENVLDRILQKFHKFLTAPRLAPPVGPPRPKVRAPTRIEVAPQMARDASTLSQSHMMTLTREPSFLARPDIADVPPELCHCAAQPHFHPRNRNCVATIEDALLELEEETCVDDSELPHSSWRHRFFQLETALWRVADDEDGCLSLQEAQRIAVEYSDLYDLYLREGTIERCCRSACNAQNRVKVVEFVGDLLESTLSRQESSV
eukprot:m.183552 g.183552  ORF g.183552 m.183552 type:complete len:337 (-) comp10496_c0_seq8:2910-3920(-)